MPSVFDEAAHAHHNIEPIRNIVLRDADLRNKLSAIEDWSEFARAVVGVGEQIGASVSFEDFNAMRKMNAPADGPGLLASEIAQTTDVELLDGCIPLRVSWRSGAPIVSWFLRGDIAFTDPFFTHTALACMQRPFNTLFRQETSVEMIGQFVNRWPGLQPNGIIYHMSRCGSTLVTQMFAAVPSITVLSEPDPVDALLDYGRHNSSLNAELVAQWIRWVVEAIVGPGSGDARGLIIKTDSWHILKFDVLRLAFPHLPWIYLYRDPVEVLVSLRRMCGRRAMPGAIEPQILGLTLAQACSMTQDSYRAWLLNSIGTAALEYMDDGGVPVIYTDLPEAVIDWLPEYFGMRFNTDETNIMRAASSKDAKQPLQVFKQDSAEKRSAATDEIRDLAQGWLYPVFERLKEVRTNVS